MAHDSRPLSPDMQIYRPQLTSVLVDQPPHHRSRSECRHAAGGCLADCGGGGISSIFNRTEFFQFVAWDFHDAGMDIFAFLSSLQRHSASRLGRWLRF